jgi:hypothetical protein
MEGMQSDNFLSFHQKLYEKKIFFSFMWQKWVDGQNALQDPNADFFLLFLLQLSMYLTIILREDHFSADTFRDWIMEC